MTTIQVNGEEVDEITPLIDPTHLHVSERAALAGRGRGHDASSIISSHVSRDELALADTAIGERLPYNAYTTIDWLHDLVLTR
jgi:chloride channel 3/4/5